MKYAPLLLLFFLLIGCKKKKVKYHEVCKSGDIEILLLDVHDSRCPSDVECVWQGNAQISLRMLDGDQMADFFLNTNDIYTQDTTVLGTHVELLKVSPYPKSTETYSLDDYTIKLKIG